VSIVPFKKKSRPSPAFREVSTAIRAGQMGPARAGRAIVVGGGKGGTGKSLITANLAVLASLRGREVVAVDADLGLANLHLLLGVEPEADLSSLLNGRWSAQRPRPELLQHGPAGVRLLPGAAGIGRLASLNRGDLRRLVHRLEPYLKDSELVLLDLSSGLSPSTQLFLRAGHEVVIVVNPEPTAMLDAYGVIKMLAESGHAGQIHLVMNRVHDLQAARECAGRIVTTSHRHLDRGVNYVGSVPEDEAVIASVQRRRPVVLDQPQSPAAAALRAIAQQLIVDAAPGADTLSTFFSTAKALVAPRRRSKSSSCAL
jgi:flagellar biosynthesis protein FlhG